MKKINISNIIFMGTPEIGAIVLADLIKAGVNITAVVTQPDRPSGRGCIHLESPVKNVSLEKKIPVYQPATKADLTQLITKLKPDLCIVAAYGMIIPDEALAVPKYGMINFHPSLLPLLRGPSPIPMAIMCGHKETGVSIIQISAAMDAGDILAQQKVQLSGIETTPSLSIDLAHLGAKMIVDLIPAIEAGTVCYTKQNDSEATFTPIIKKADGEVIFHEYHAQNINQAARAFYPWPGIFTTWKGKKLEILEPDVVKGKFEPGLVFEKDGKLLIGCAKDAIAPNYLKLEGKNKQSTAEFMCGYQNFISTTLQ